MQAAQPQKKVFQQQSVAAVNDTVPLTRQEGGRSPVCGNFRPGEGCSSALSGTERLADVGVVRPPESGIQLAPHKSDYKRKTNPFKRAPSKIAKKLSSLDPVRPALVASKLSFGMRYISPEKRHRFSLNLWICLSDNST